MRIISKYKDFYDFLTGIYGTDPLITLDRREFEIPMLIDEQKITLFIAGKRIEGFYKDNKFYYGDKLEKFNKSTRIFSNREHHYNDFYYVQTKHDRFRIPILKDIVDCNVNEKCNHPILMSKYYRVDSTENIKNYYKFPILKDLGIQSYIEPEKMWLMLVNFLTKKDIVDDHRTNNEKILCAGFDLKESFRGKPVS